VQVNTLRITQEQLAEIRALRDAEDAASPGEAR
jgi:hypothetical protein